MKKLLAKIRKILKDRRTRQLLTRIVSVTAAIVVFVTTYALVLPAITMETEAQCGIPAHQHDDSCYEEILTCEIPESEGHHHTEDCYTTKQELDCKVEEHQHGADCYDADGNLVCGLTEHTHSVDNGCYEEVRDLTCEIPESDGHQHDSSCYEKVLTCGKEAHTHSVECYSDSTTADTEDAAVEISSGGGTSAAAASTGNAEAGVDNAVAGTGAAESAGKALTIVDNAEAGITEDGQDGHYVPELAPINFSTVLDNHTGIYYHAVEDGEVVEDSTALTYDKWNRVKDNTELGTADLLRVYLAYTIPAGALNPTNPVARYRLPGNLHLSDAQVKAISETVNGIASQYVNMDTLEILDTEKYYAYLGIEAVEGTRTPIDDPDKYLADISRKTGTTASEYISATIRVENVYDEQSGELTAQDLVFTWTPYTIEKNQHEYDSTGNPTKAGEEISGWLSLDFNLSQVDFPDPDITTFERKIENETETDQAVENHSEEEQSAGAVENTAAVETVEHREQTADIIFVEEGRDENNQKIHEISTTLTVVEESVIDTHVTDDQTPEDTIRDGETVDGTEESDEPSTGETADAADADEAIVSAEDDNKESADPEANQVIMPAMSFNDSITVRTGKPADIDENAGGTVANAADALPEKAEVTVRVEADEGTFPAGTTMKLKAVDNLDDVAKAVTETVENPAASFDTADVTESTDTAESIDYTESTDSADAVDSAEGKTGNKQSTEEAPQDQSEKTEEVETKNTEKAQERKNLKTYGFQAVDITFVDAEGNEIEPAKPVRVALSSATVEQAKKDAENTAVTDPVVVHVDDEGNAEQMELVAPEEIEPAQGKTEEELLEEASGESGSQEEAELVNSPANEDTADSSGNIDESKTVQNNTGGQTIGNGTSDSPSNQDEIRNNTADVNGVDEQSDTADQEAEDIADDANTASTVGFKTDSFSVYAIVYTVDFHYDVDGKTYDFSIAGGDSIGLKQLLGILGVVRETTEPENTAGEVNRAETSSGDTENAEAGEAGAAPDDTVNTAAEEANTIPEKTVNAIEETAVDSEAAGDAEESPAPKTEVHKSRVDIFIEDIDTVVFSDPSLIHVEKILEDTTCKEIIERNRLQIEYSAELEEAVIATRGEKKYTAPDYALVSIRAFDTEEDLTIRMKSGEVFVIRVTDMHNTDPLGLDGMQYMIVNSNQALRYNNKKVNASPLNQAGDNCTWKIEYDPDAFDGTGGYYLISHVNTYIKVDANGISLVDNKTEMQGEEEVVVATPFKITFDQTKEINASTGEKGAYRLSISSDQGSAYLNHFNNGGSNYGFNISNVDTDSVWMALRAPNASTTPGTIGTWDIKKDGIVLKMFDYNGTVTSNGQSRDIDVVWGNSVTEANLRAGNGINKNRTLLFSGSGLDGSSGSSVSKRNQFTGEWEGYYKNNSNNTSHYAKRANQGIVSEVLGEDGFPRLAGTSSNWQSADRTDGGSLAYLFDETRADGSTMIAYPGAKKTDEHGQEYGNGTGLEGLLRKDERGYYYYDSEQNYARMVGNEIILYSDTYKKDTATDGIERKEKIGFFPFDDYNTGKREEKGPTAQNNRYEHQFGMSMETDFIYPTDGRLPETGDDMIFEFSGDDDLWVFIDGRLVLDIGGVHQPVKGTINFHTMKVTVEDWYYNPNLNGYGNGGYELHKIEQDISDLFPADKPFDNTSYSDHKLKMFYLERGGCDSNLAIRFNLMLCKILTLEKKLTGLTEEERAKYKDELFEYEVAFVENEDGAVDELVEMNDEQLWGEDAEHSDWRNEYGFQLYNTAVTDGNDRLKNHTIRRKWNPETKKYDVLEEGFPIVNGKVWLKDGESVRIANLPVSGIFYAAEEDKLDMTQFERPHAERLYHEAGSDDSYEEEIELHDDTTLYQEEDGDLHDWETRPYPLKTTEKIVYTNTLREKNLDVMKEWSDGLQKHAADAGDDAIKSINFVIKATVPSDNEGEEPREYIVEALKQKDIDGEYIYDPDDNTKILDKVFTLSEENDWHQLFEHLPAQTPVSSMDEEPKEITYTIVEETVPGYTSVTSFDLLNKVELDIAKYWPDHEAGHTEEIPVRIRDKNGKYVILETDEYGHLVTDEDGDYIFKEFTAAKANASQVILGQGAYSARIKDCPKTTTTETGDTEVTTVHQPYRIEQVTDHDESTTGLVLFERPVWGYKIRNVEFGINIEKNWPEDFDQDTLPDDAEVIFTLKRQKMTRKKGSFTLVAAEKNLPVIDGELYDPVYVIRSTEDPDNYTYYVRFSEMETAGADDVEGIDPDLAQDAAIKKKVLDLPVGSYTVSVAETPDDYDVARTISNGAATTVTVYTPEEGEEDPPLAKADPASITITQDYSRHTGYLKIKKVLTDDYADASFMNITYTITGDYINAPITVQADINDFSVVDGNGVFERTVGPVPVGSYNVSESISTDLTDDKYLIETTSNGPNIRVTAGADEENAALLESQTSYRKNKAVQFYIRFVNNQNIEYSDKAIHVECSAEETITINFQVSDRQYYNPEYWTNTDTTHRTLHTGTSPQAYPGDNNRFWVTYPFTITIPSLSQLPDGETFVLYVNNPWDNANPNVMFGGELNDYWLTTVSSIVNSGGTQLYPPLLGGASSISSFGRSQSQALSSGKGLTAGDGTPGEGSSEGEDGTESEDTTKTNVPKKVNTSEIKKPEEPYHFVPDEWSLTIAMKKDGKLYLIEGTGEETTETEIGDFEIDLENGKWSAFLEEHGIEAKDGPDYYYYYIDSVEEKNVPKGMSPSFVTDMDGKRLMVSKLNETIPLGVNNALNQTIDITFEKVNEKGEDLEGVIFQLQVLKKPEPSEDSGDTDTGGETDDAEESDGESEGESIKGVYQPVYELDAYKEIMFNSGAKETVEVEGEDGQTVEEIRDVESIALKAVTLYGKNYTSTFTTTFEEEHPEYRMRLEGLPDGEFKLIELKAPDGYVITLNEICFKIEDGVMEMVTEGDTLVFTPAVENEETPTLANLKVINIPGVELPNSGGPGTKVIYLAGTLLTLLGVVILMERKTRA